jgi:hypothetical protein
MPRLNARALKCTLVLNADEITAIGDPVTPRVVLTIAVPDYGPVSADIAGKSLRKAQAAIAEHGAEGVACVLQGKLVSGGKIAEAGLVAQLRAPKQTEAEATASAPSHNSS